MQNSKFLKDYRFRSNPNLSWNSPRYSNKVYNNILECIGNTPLVKLNKIPQEYGLQCEIYAKCEYFNPGGSVKDRVGLELFRDAQKHGVVNKDTQFVEATSGNTGLAIAFVATLNGNKSTIVTNTKCSDEKVNIMRLVGGNVNQVKGTESSEALARKIVDQDHSRNVLLNQFNNDVNPKTHYHQTAEEILAALGSVDMASMGAGTGGTISGIGHKLKENNPQCIIVGAEPDGSIQFTKQGKYRKFLVEGIGGKRPAITLDVTIADRVEYVTDKEAFLMARELGRKEGLLCGASSGVAMMAAIKAAKALNLPAGKRVVVLLPDGIRNYMTKFVSDQWMEAYRFMEPPQHTMTWWKIPVTELKTRKYPDLSLDTTCAEAMQVMSNDVDLAVVNDDNGYYAGVASKDGFRNYATNPVRLSGLSSEEFDFNSPVKEYLVKHVYTLALNSKQGVPTLGLVSRVLDIAPFVVIVEENNYGENSKAKGIVKAEDVIDYIYGAASYGTKRYFQ